MERNVVVVIIVSLVSAIVVLTIVVLVERKRKKNTIDLLSHNNEQPKEHSFKIINHFVVYPKESQF